MRPSHPSASDGLPARQGISGADPEFTLCVIGAGNIGSRHLQGLARAGFRGTIHVVDPSSSALDLAKSRVLEIKPSDRLHFRYAASLAALPQRIDLAILACGAAPRRMLTEQLLASHDVGAVLFEKFLFQTIADHREIGALLAQKGIPAWVNTPRRAWPDYRELLQRLEGRGPLTMTISRNLQHGLATNLIHMVDLLAFLAGGQPRVRLAGRELKMDKDASRHADAIEFTGNVFGYTPRGDALVIRAPLDPACQGQIEIACGDGYVAIDEKNSRIVEIAPGEAPVIRPFRSLYQSDLTGRIAADILGKGACDLPDYAQSAGLHIECLKAFLEAMGKDRDDEFALCPIT